VWRSVLAIAVLTVVLLRADRGVAVSHPSAGVDAILAEVRQATAGYLDVERARADGFVQISGMEPRHGYHFARIDAGAAIVTALAGGQLDLTRPPMLLYVERGGVWQLAGVEYALPARPATNPFPGAEWHEHEASCHYRDFRELPGVRAGDCPARHLVSGEPFVLWHPTFAVVHVWAWYPNPDGPFAPENAYLAAYGGVPAAAAGHRHARNPAEAIYSQYTHRIAGVVLLTIAALIAWETRRPRPWPWSALSSIVWIVFGLYLIPTSDPESWPWGPQRFGEIFADPVVLQHKLLALVPIVLGIVGLLRLRGRLRRPSWTYVVPVLAVLSGLSLFFHFHDGRFHLDAIYLQHAVMGTAALGVGAVLLLAGRRRERHAALARWSWPAFLLVLGLVLLAYFEL
jgi:uncharacterized membrane protein HdeD (DUF308 family)